MDVEAEEEAGSGSAKDMPLSPPHHSKKHTVNNLSDIILSNLLDIILQCQIRMDARSHHR